MLNWIQLLTSQHNCVLILLSLNNTHANRISSNEDFKWGPQVFPKQPFGKHYKVVLWNIDINTTLKTVIWTRRNKIPQNPSDNHRTSTYSKYKDNQLSYTKCVHKIIVILNFFKKNFFINNYLIPFKVTLLKHAFWYCQHFLFQFSFYLLNRWVLVSMS